MATEHISKPIERVMASIKRPMLADEIKAVFNERGEAYGAPEDCFKNIAAAWAAYLNQRFTLRQLPIEQLDGKDVCVLMMMLKGIREGNAHKHDNLLDIVGYAECAARCVTQRKPE